MNRRSCICAALAGALVVAACSSTDPGVSVQRADTGALGTADSTVVTTAATDPPGSVDPPGTTAPPETDPTASSSPDAPDGPTGVSGVGDELFPDLGNPGIDVTHYDIVLEYDAASAVITATVTLTVDATSELSTFTLDQVGLQVEDVAVDGAPAEFDAVDPELVVTLPVAVPAGDEFTVSVEYSTGSMGTQAAAGRSAGWFPTPLGSFTLNEPDGARTWMPSNDHPSDKATYRFELHLPDDVTGIANGSLESGGADPDGDGTLWIWNQPEPQTTYVVQVLTGPYTVVTDQSADGLPLVSAILTDDVDLMQPYLDVTPEQIDFFEEYFGPYPFDSYGIAMTDLAFGGAMEEQGRSLFGRDDFTSGELGYYEELLLSHELGHQWFGDAVAPARWRDIWLNESFASYAEWMWLDHAGYISLSETADLNLEQRQGGTVATGTPTAEGLFGYEVYEGGAVVLHALRSTVGDDAFFEILQRWVADNIDTSRTTDDFVAVTEAVSGQDMTQFFDDWLYATDLPDAYPG